MASRTDKNGKYSKLSQQEVELGASLVAPDPKDMDKPASAVPMLELVAPATLVEGYELEVEVGDKVVAVAIPVGGVEKGQKFAVPMDTTTADGLVKKKMKKSTIPIGAWKDGLCDCCTYGPCHATLWTAWFCPLLAAGQLATRLQLNFLGFPTREESAQKSAFRTLLWITVGYWICSYGLDIAGSMAVANKLGQANVGESGSSIRSNQHQAVVPDYTGAQDTIMMFNLLEQVLRCCFAMFCFFLVYNIRGHVRSKYKIKDGGEAQDLSYAFCCTPCVTSQLLRHTGDYENTPTRCCSDTGLVMSPHVQAANMV